MHFKHLFISFAFMTSAVLATDGDLISDPVQDASHTYQPMSLSNYQGDTRDLTDTAEVISQMFAEMSCEQSGDFLLHVLETWPKENIEQIFDRVPLHITEQQLLRLYQMCGFYPELQGIVSGCAKRLGMTTRFSPLFALPAGIPVTPFLLRARERRIDQFIGYTSLPLTDDAFSTMLEKCIVRLRQHHNPHGEKILLYALNVNGYVEDVLRPLFAFVTSESTLWRMGFQNYDARFAFIVDNMVQPGYSASNLLSIGSALEKMTENLSLFCKFIAQAK